MTITAEIPTIIGTSFAGGFYAGRIIEDDKIYALIVAPKDSEVSLPWKKAVEHCGALRVGGFEDWTLPNRLESLVIFQALAQRRASVPEFQEDGEQSFEKRWYWTGEEYEFHPDGAWRQHFDDGLQSVDGKVYVNFVRAVRKVLIP